MNKNFVVKLVSWDRYNEALTQVRDQVFIIEQQIPKILERDKNDEKYFHVAAIAANEEVIGTGRMTPEGKIGRMAVVKNWRGKGVGQGLLTKLIEHSMKLELSFVTLDAQITAVNFYTSNGFHAIGERFMDAGIPHIKMTRTFK